MILKFKVGMEENVSRDDWEHWYIQEKDSWWMIIEMFRDRPIDFVRDKCW